MGRVVAELGRPETPDETAARKAESSRIYRSSQNVRNLVAAIIATLALVVVIIAIVPRGTPPERESIDVAAVAAPIQRSVDTTLIVPAAPVDWLVNEARIEQSTPSEWRIAYAPGENMYIRVAQGIAADPGWVDRMLVGGVAGDTITLDGVDWTIHTFRDPAKSRNVAYALSTQAGSDAIVVYGVADEELMQTFAASLSTQVKQISEETQ